MRHLQIQPELHRGPDPLGIQDIQQIQARDIFHTTGHRYLLLVVYDLDIERIAVTPDETQQPLVVDADTMLPGPVPRQRFQTIGRSRSQFLQPRR